MPEFEKMPQEIIEWIKTRKELPVIVLQDMVVFPHISVPIAVRRKKSLDALNNVMQNHRVALFAAQKDRRMIDPGPEEIYAVGTICKIRETKKMPDGTINILIDGLTRAKITEYTQTKPFIKANVEVVEKPAEKKTEEMEILKHSVLNQFRKCVDLGAIVPLDVLLLIFNMSDPWQMADLIVINTDFDVEERQGVLEAVDAKEKLKKVSQGLARQINILKAAKKITTETGKELGKMQKEVFLREQLRAIEKELGIEKEKGETSELREKIKRAKMPEEANKKVLKELDRLEHMPPFSPEISYIRTYLDWMTNVPWSKKSKSKIDIKEAEKILNDDHYGLKKVKERILEYLAVQKLVGKIKGPILCFVGPPGTGKTSIGKSIARALDRKFFRMSLGGIHDEAEIRGHRRTYVGALPGRIIQGIANVGTRNPVFMLDEIDKVGADFRGDPSAALLEALDPEQNYAFSDHYLESPFDLSDVMFITTANVLDTIPPALLDRMEIIDFPSYIEEEKFRIAKNYLLSKQLKNNGLTEKDLIIEDDALRSIVREYTREAGVRNLEREIAAVCRKVAKDVAINGKNGKKAVKIAARDLKKFLGPSKFPTTMAEKKDEAGVATGLAWTQVGGEILLIEATKMPGKGNLILTGHLGEVMKESAQAAFSYTRSIAKKLGLKDKFYQDQDIHIHVPAGAIPKDGPSAGIAMGTALVSVLTGKPIKKTVGMTGEITLRGHVLEIGGVKEKVLAAHRAQLKTIILPKNNEKDLEEIPKEVLKDLKFVFVEQMDEVLRAALKNT